MTLGGSYARIETLGDCVPRYECGFAGASRDRPSLGGWAEWQRAYATELLAVEARRAFDRLRLQRALDDEEVARVHEAATERAIGQIRLTPAILRRAGQAMPTVVKTLDALHLASALVFEESREEGLVFATHDRQQAIAARALGFEVVGAT